MPIEKLEITLNYFVVSNTASVPLRMKCHFHRGRRAISVTSSSHPKTSANRSVSINNFLQLVLDNSYLMGLDVVYELSILIVWIVYM